MRRPGAFAAVDARGRLQEVGWEKFATLEMLGWAAQYLDYLADVEARMRQPHLRVPLFEREQGESKWCSLPPSRRPSVRRSVEGGSKLLSAAAASDDAGVSVTVSVTAQVFEKRARRE